MKGTGVWKLTQEPSFFRPFHRGLLGEIEELRTETR
jgi:hypothetical protein